MEVLREHGGKEMAKYTENYKGVKIYQGLNIESSCPWCKKKDELGVVGMTLNDFVLCKRCECRGPIADSPEDAVRKWDEQ